jgi:hypothetical protein
VFHRGRDQLPRGNGTLMLRLIFHDKRDRLYDNVSRMVETPAGAFAFLQEYIDRTEGRPVKKVERRSEHTSRFVFTTRDGQEVPALPAPRLNAGTEATPAAPSRASREDAVILGLAGLR